MEIFLWLVMITAGVYALRGRAQAKRVRTRYAYHGMLLLTGIPGSGKTYRLVDRMVQRLAEGRHVRINYNIRHDRVYLALKIRYKLTHREAMQAIGRITYLDTFEDYIDAYDCDLFISEAQDVLSSKDWDIFPHEMQGFFAQHRHRLCRVMLESHRFGSIHNYIRELISDVVLARPAPWFCKPFYYLMRGRADLPLLQYINIKDAEEEVTGAKPKPRKGISHALNLSFTPLDPLIASCYDTHGGVRPSPMATIRRERRKHELDLTLQPRREFIIFSEPSALDYRPFLSHEEYVAFLERRISPGEALGMRWRDDLPVAEAA